MTILMSILGWLTSGPLDRIFKTIDTSIDNETKREEIKTRAVESYLSAQVSVLTGRGWWFPLLFLIPAGLWFAAVCVYSVLWCKACAFPQDWSIAALPPPLNDWMGAIVGSLFIGKAGESIIARVAEMSEMKEGAAMKHWTIDKRVPLALILAISVQTCGIVWWASGLTTRVEQLERQAQAMAPQDTRLTRVEVRLDNVVDGISEIKALLRPPVTALPK